MCQLCHPLLEKSFTHSKIHPDRLKLHWECLFFKVLLIVCFGFDISMQPRTMWNNQLYNTNSLLLKQNEMFIIWGNSEIPRFTHFLFHLSQHAGTVSGTACCASSYDTSKASSRPPTSYLSLFVCQRIFQNLVMPPELNFRFRCAFDNFFIRWSDF